MTKTTELEATLAMVNARLASEPKSRAEWESIAEGLRACARYATKVALLKSKLESSTGGRT